jgi:hypothetical protein
VLHDRHSNFFSCFHGRSLPQCEEPGPKLEETLSCGAAGWPGGDGESEGARERVAPSSLTLWRRVSPRALRFARDSPLEGGREMDSNLRFPDRSAPVSRAGPPPMIADSRPPHLAARCGGKFTRPAEAISQQRMCLVV